MGFHPTIAHQYLGQWVRCHSVYGVHRGVVSRVLPDGIVLTNVTQLASESNGRKSENVHGIYKSNNAENKIAHVFFGGFFVPFGGIYGLYPGFGFGAGFIW
ncbi:hypothetical protein DNHGIG_38990 [Collibacillus ludicampi]|uniref:Uncharacterized protein n=1 Tax=Collibacillus ludicampi TaxID=2771369 RepID=A0AAV4LKG6_9BACL|nr:hypothetical protein [Collibacillus ludicampi]GIM48350.1 hypothetical protein DNHGIG_38990 [Collibacillus ludicampi]